MKKRGQFYLIAALVIVGIVTSLAAVYNSSKTPEEDTTVYDLSQEIDFESSQVIDNGVYQGSTSNTANNIINLANHYCQKTTEDTDFVVVYGTSQSASIVTCEDTSGGLAVSTGGISATQNIITRALTTAKKYKGHATGITAIGTVDVQGGKFNKQFTLSAADQFFIVVQRDKQTDRYVSVEDD